MTDTVGLWNLTAMSAFLLIIVVCWQIPFNIFRQNSRLVRTHSQRNRLYVDNVLQYDKCENQKIPNLLFTRGYYTEKEGRAAVLRQMTRTRADERPQPANGSKELDFLICLDTAVA
jgi:hypothetical protein